MGKYEKDSINTRWINQFFFSFLTFNIFQHQSRYIRELGIADHHNWVIWDRSFPIIIIIDVAAAAAVSELKQSTASQMIGCSMAGAVVFVLCILSAPSCWWLAGRPYLSRSRSDSIVWRRCWLGLFLFVCRTFVWVRFWIRPLAGRCRPTVDRLIAAVRRFVRGAR